MRAEVTTEPLDGIEADLEAVELGEGDELPKPYAEATGAGDVRAAFKKLTLLRPDPKRRVLVVGLGARGRASIPSGCGLQAAMAWPRPGATRRVAGLDAARLAGQRERYGPRGGDRGRGRDGLVSI